MTKRQKHFRHDPSGLESSSSTYQVENISAWCVEGGQVRPDEDEVFQCIRSLSLLTKSSVTKTTSQNNILEIMVMKKRIDVVTFIFE